ncbi:hypothetical protein BDZ45DRAFT_288076 [Acephala macrosclerotiorum]|nr:hypothetical protein BDZ45DRAFT_288076 [Acephala macrosclerotiorum]
MKCVGSDNPPCARCAKAGRECIVQKSDRTQAPDNSNGFRPDISHQNLGHQRNVTDSNPSYGGSAPLNGHANQVWRTDEGLFLFFTISSHAHFPSLTLRFVVTLIHSVSAELQVSC